MRYLVVVALIAVGCSGSKPHAVASPADVEAALRAAHLDPHRITYTLSAPQPQGSIGLSEALQESSADYVPLQTLMVEDGRALVSVFASQKGAREYKAFLDGRGTRVRNVVVISPRPPISPRLRRALARLP